MKYGTPLAEAAYLLSIDHAEAKVGESSEYGVGRMYQALVVVSRGHLIRADLDYAMNAIRPGREYLVWIVEDEEGHITEHKSADVDSAIKTAKDMREQFAGVTAHYEKPIDWSKISDGFASVRKEEA